MKYYLITTLGLVCLVLIIALVATKRSQHVQHENDAGVITDYSNQLTSAQTRLAIHQGRILTLSNSLEESVSISSGLSNRLAEALSTIAQNQGQITNLNKRVTEVDSRNQILARRVMDLTNQIAGLTRQIASGEATLHELSNDYVKNYALLENRLRRDVAERLIAERRFNNLSELQAQIEKLKQRPSAAVTTERILAGLDVEVRSNGTFHVLSPQ